MREYGSEHPSVLLPDGYFDSLKKFGREMTYLRTGREALLYVSRNCQPDKTGVILCPAYSCWSMVAPFEAAGWKVRFYRLNQDLTIDEDYLEKLLPSAKPDAILIMNFYGSSSTQYAIPKIKKFDPRITVIEDFSHCTFCLENIFNESVDFYVTSIRKSVGVCDGALALSKRPTDSSYIDSPAPDFGKLRLKAQCLKRRYATTKSKDEKDLFLSDLRNGEEMINQLDGVHPISDVSLKMLETINGEEIAFARRENMKHLWEALRFNVKMIPGIEKSFKGAPFSLPILVEDRDEVQKKLAQKGVYAPVLWPINKDARMTCENSAYISDHMLSLPVDQRYDWDDIEDIARIVSETI